MSMEPSTDLKRSCFGHGLHVSSSSYIEGTSLKAFSLCREL